MSDPAKNTEIEDVLSSIRRLVSENHVGASKASAAPEKPVDVPAAETPKPAPASDRLVLSPALRVEDAPEEHRAEPTSPVEDTPFANSLKEDILPLRESLPSFLQKRLDQAEDRAGEQTEEMEQAAPEEVEEDADDALTFVHDAAEPSVEEPAITLQFPAPEELTFETARAPQDEADEDAVKATAEDARPWDIEGERLAEWHSVRANEPEHFDPDGPEDGDNAGTPVATLNWEDHEVEEAEVEEVAPTKPAPTPDPVAEHIAEAVVDEIAPSEDTIDAQQYDAVLDEEMLRELVGEIVRQELQGPLGERITRNVRKLVRREINRALTARNFNDS